MLSGKVHGLGFWWKKGRLEKFRIENNCSFITTLLSNITHPIVMLVDAFAQRDLGNGQDYVLHFAAARQHGLVTSLSNTSLNVLPFDPMTVKTSEEVRTIANIHQGPITDMKPFDENSVFTSGEDGVKLWDLRTKSSSPAQTFVPDSGSPLCCIDSQGNKLAAGTQLVGVDAGVVFWDIRKGNKQSLAYVDSHSDDVTQVQFHPNDPHGVLSGSTDGLINIYNTSIEDEDDAVYNAINNGSSIHRAGFITNGNANKIFALSHMETFSIHHIANNESITETPPASVEFGDVRDKWDCQYVADVMNGYIAVGSNNDKFSFKLLPYDNDQSVDTSNPISLNNAHGEEVVRCIYMDPQYRCIYTGGEDGIVKVWTPQEDFKIPTEIDDGEWEASDKDKKKHKKKDKEKKDKEKSDKKSEKKKKKEKRYNPY